MLILNFAHPLTEEQLDQVAELTGLAPEALEVRAIPTHMDMEGSFAQQVVALADRCGLSPEEWQTTPLIVVPPALSSAAVALLAEIHGRTGYFVPIVRMKQEFGGAGAKFSVAEVLDLQHIRVQARMRRG